MINASLVWVFGLAIAVVAGSAGANPATERLETLMAQWIALEKQRDQLVHDWQQQQLVLQQRLSLLKLEEQSLNKQIKKHSGVQSRVQQHRAELSQQQTRLEQNQQSMTSALQRTSAAVAAIAPRLPEPLAQHWQTLLAKTGESDQPESNSTRLEAYLSLLNSLEAFQGKVTLHQSLMEIDGRKVLADQIYLGAGQGWYLSRDGKLAGTGHAGTDSWHWRSDNNLAPQLEKIVHALKSPEQSQILGITVDLNREAQ